MKVKFEVFKSSYKSWDELFEEASDFAGRLQANQLINISHSCDHQSAVVTVWFWGKRS